MAELSPAEGGTVTAPDGRVEIDFPPAAVSESVTVTFTQRLAPAMHTGSLLFAGNAFALQARGSSGEPVTQFERAFTLTVHYHDADWQRAGVSEESSLNLYYWSAASGQWVVVPSIGQDTEANVWVGSLDHLTEFALLGAVVREGHTVYLPVIMKGY
jgi:hypothetical protein